MIVLALDTALYACQAAVLDGDRVLAERSEPMDRGHQERLAPMVAEAMAASGADFASIDRIAVTVGPGSFTGLRVGLAFAKGLALALDRPCVGVGTLEALALSAEGRGLVAGVIDARRDQVYLQAFVDRRPAMAPDVLPLPEAAARLAEFRAGAEAVLAGPGAHLLDGIAPGARILPIGWPHIAAVARAGAAGPSPSTMPRPLYLRAPDAKTLAERGVAR